MRFTTPKDLNLTSIRMPFEVTPANTAPTDWIAYRRISDVPELLAAPCHRVNGDRTCSGHRINSEVTLVINRTSKDTKKPSGNIVEQRTDLCIPVCYLPKNFQT
jgi:hypothetical protein